MENDNDIMKKTAEPIERVVSVGATRKKNNKNWLLGIIGIVACTGVLVAAILLNMQHEGNTGGVGSLTEQTSSSVANSVNDAGILNGSSIARGGSYTLTGNYQCITINTADNVELVLDGATITCDDGPAIYVQNAKAVSVILKGENTISATTTDDLEGAFHSTEDLIFSGEGTLTLTGNLDGIVSKDTLVFESATYNITTGDDCIKGKDNVVVNGGTFNLNSTDGDAIKSSNTEDSALGYIVINNGVFNIEAGQDGIQSETYTTINGGEITMVVGDDGIHATTKLEVNGGKLVIRAREGLEATYVLVKDGDVDITASDDGINAGQKTKDLAVGIEVNGGYITIDMGAGDTDAVDSNGFLTITGGTFDITAQSPFDYDGTLTYTGGTIIVNGVEVNTVTNQFMGGGMGGQMGPGGSQSGAASNPDVDTGPGANGGRAMR